MELFTFTNRETHDAYQYLNENANRLREVVQGSRESAARLAGDIEEWLIEERPFTDSSFYDSLLEATVLKIDFDNLANALLKTSKQQDQLITAKAN